MITWDQLSLTCKRWIECISDRNFDVRQSYRRASTMLHFSTVSPSINVIVKPDLANLIDTILHNGITEQPSMSVCEQRGQEKKDRMCTWQTAISRATLSTSRHELAISAECGMTSLISVESYYNNCTSKKLFAREFEDDGSARQGVYDGNFARNKTKNC